MDTLQEVLDLLDHARMDVREAVTMMTDERLELFAEQLQRQLIALRREVLNVQHGRPYGQRHRTRR